MYEIKKRRSLYGDFFCGNEASSYGKEQGYLDYATFSKAFDAVLNNDIMAALENAGFYFEPIQDGSSDYSDEIDELREKAEQLREGAETIQARADEYSELADDQDAEADETTDAEEAQALRAKAESNRRQAAELEEQAQKAEQDAGKADEDADDMENGQDAPEIFQYFIVSDQGAELIQEYTDDPLFYCSDVDMYIWGVTHYGTSWSYVLTDVKLNAGEAAWN